MRRGELFDLTELRVPLTLDQKNNAVQRVVFAAQCGAKYTYTIKEACGILNISRDEIDFLIHFYRLDTLALGTIYRIPWYSLAEFLLDTDDDINTDQLDLDEVKVALTESPIERLPCVPVFLSRKECAMILGVSTKLVNKLIDAGRLPLVKIPDDSFPACYDLFGMPIEQSYVEYILRPDLVELLEKKLLCHKPILAPEDDH